MRRIAQVNIIRFHFNKNGQSIIVGHYFMGVFGWCESVLFSVPLIQFCLTFKAIDLIGWFIRAERALVLLT